MTPLQLAVFLEDLDILQGKDMVLKCSKWPFWSLFNLNRLKLCLATKLNMYGVFSSRKVCSVMIFNVKMWYCFWHSSYWSALTSQIVRYYHLLCELYFRRQGRWIGEKRNGINLKLGLMSLVHFIYSCFFLVSPWEGREMWFPLLHSVYKHANRAANNLLISPLVWELWSSISNNSVIPLFSKYEYFIAAQPAKPTLRQTKEDWKKKKTLLNILL